MIIMLKNIFQKRQRTKMKRILKQVGSRVGMQLTTSLSFLIYDLLVGAEVQYIWKQLKYMKSLRKNGLILSGVDSPQHRHNGWTLLSFIICLSSQGKPLDECVNVQIGISILRPKLFACKQIRRQ